MVCVAELSGPALRRLHAGCDRRRAASVVPGARVTVLSAHRRACRAASDERAGEPREQHAKHVCTSMRRACPRALSQVNAAAPVQGATIGGRRCCGAASHARSLMYVKPARVRVLHIADAGRSRRRGAAAFARPALPASRAGGERAAGSDMRRRALDLPRRPFRSVRAMHCARARRRSSACLARVERSPPAVFHSMRAKRNGAMKSKRNPDRFLVFRCARGIPVDSIDRRRIGMRWPCGLARAVMRSGIRRRRLARKMPRRSAFFEVFSRERIGSMICAGDPY